MKKAARLFFILLLVVIAVVTVVAVKNSGKKMMYPLRYEQYIEKYAKKYELDPCLVMGVIKAESNYIYDAHSGVARGLMQITEDTAQWIARQLDLKHFESDDIENPEMNIRMGCYYLHYLIEHYGDVDVALAAYNGGMGNVTRWLGDKHYSSDGKTLDYIPFKETREYVEKVNKYTQTYREMYQKE